MHQEERLQNKYDRLCVEYNKLRNKQKELKELANSHLDTAKRLQTILAEKESCIKQLEQKCETLRCENARLQSSTQAPTTDNHVEAYRMAEVAKVREKSRSVSEPDGLSVTPSSDSDINRLVCSLTKALNQWNDAIRSGERPPESKEVKNALIEQIARLERQVCEVSLECQLERRRRLMLDKERSSSALNELTGTNGDLDITAADQPRKNEGLASDCRTADPNGVSESLMLDWMQQRIYTITDQARYFAARAAFLQDELSCLMPYVTQLADEALRYRTEAASTRAALKQMQTELDTAHANAVRQSTELAEHITNLTEELQQLRASGRQCPIVVDGNAGGCGVLQQSSSSASSLKKGSFFKVLKR